MSHGRLGKVVALAAWSIAGCSATTEGSTTPVERATPSVATDLESETTAPIAFFCGGFGAEHVPSVLGLDVNSGAIVWRVCDQAGRPPQVLGRAVGATLLMRQDVRTAGAEMFALDDAGVELWSRPYEIMSQLMFIDSVVVLYDHSVVAIDALTGEELWHQELTNGTPVAVGKGMVLEILGGPYVGSGVPSHPADAGLATLRAVDARKGAEKWARDIQVVALPPPNQYSPTAGNEVLAVPTSLERGTAVIDIGSGADLLQVSGVAQAVGNVLLQLDSAGSAIRAVMDVDGTQLTAGVLGYPAGLRPDAEHFVNGTDLLVLRGGTGSVKTYDLVDMTTGATRSSLGQAYPLARSEDFVLASTGDSVRLIDPSSGDLQMHYEAPATRIYFTEGALGDGIAIVVPKPGGA